MSDEQYFYLHSGSSEYVLALQGGVRTPGASLATRARQSGEQGEWQLWTLTTDGYLRHKMTGLVVDIAHSQTAPGSQVIAWLPNDPRTPNQSWTLTPDGHLRSDLGDLVLGVAGDLAGQDTPVQTWTPDRSDTQIWQFVRDVPPVGVVTGQALSLDGTDQVVEIPAPNFGTADLTVETWVRTTTGGPILASVRKFVQEEDVALSIESGGALHFAMSDTAVTMMVTSGPTTILDGEWHHVAAVRRGVDALLYLDGVAVPAAPDAVAYQPVSLGDPSILLLGEAIRPPALWDQSNPPRTFLLDRYQFAGELDEVRIWGRERTPAEIAAGLHHLVSDTDPDLLGRWSFDGGSAADSTPAGRHGTVRGAPTFVDSEVELVAPGEPYLVTQAKLTQDWVTDPDAPTGMREITGYRVVIAARGPDASPLRGHLTLSVVADKAALHFTDGTSVDLAGDALCVRATDARGEVSFTIDANGSLNCPAVKVRADFMALAERVVVYPDRHAHSTMASITGNALLGRDENGAPLPSVAKKLRPTPIPAGTDPAAADAVAQAISHVMSTAVRHDVQSDRPLTRSRLLPEDLPVPRPYTPRYQDVGLVAQGYDPASDAVGTHFLAADQPVVRVLVAENAPIPHWTYDHVGRKFRAMSANDVATALSGLNVVHLDDYTRTFQLDPEVFLGKRTITMRSDKLLDTAEGELSARWFGGDFLAEVERAASVVVTTVETTVTDVVTKAENIVRTIVVTVVTGITDAVTGLVQAFDAALQTVEDALDFVGAVLRKVGAKIAEVVEFLRDLFEWDDILISQQVIEKYLVESRSVLGRMLDGAGTRAIKAVESFRLSLDQDLARWRASLNPDTAQQQSTTIRTAPPQNIQSNYLTSMFGANADAGTGGATLAGEFGSVVGGLADELTKTITRFTSGAPDLIDTSGFSGAFADPNKLLGAGIDLVLQAVGVVADLALEIAEDVLRAILALLDKLLDALYALGTTRLDIPVLTPFYEQVVTRGNGSKLTLFSLVALAAAVPMTVSYKALSGRDEPVFSAADRDAFLALSGSDYTWIRDPFAVTTLASAPAPLKGEVIDRLGWASGFVYSAGATVWGIAATGSDVIWTALVATAGSSASLFGEEAPDQPKFQKPLCYAVLGSQLVCLIAGIPWATNFAATPDAIAFGLWASQAVPLLSNLVAAATDTWGQLGDPALTGAYGVVALGITAWLWYERDQAKGADPANDAAEGIGNIFGSLTWCAQLIKLSPKQSFYTVAALLLLDVVAYGGLAVTTLARTIDSMVETLG